MVERFVEWCFLVERLVVEFLVVRRFLVGQRVAGIELAVTEPASLAGYRFG